MLDWCRWWRNGQSRWTLGGSMGHITIGIGHIALTSCNVVFRNWLATVNGVFCREQLLVLLSISAGQIFANSPEKHISFHHDLRPQCIRQARLQWQHWSNRNRFHLWDLLSTMIRTATNVLFEYAFLPCVPLSIYLSRTCTHILTYAYTNETATHIHTHCT